VEKEIEKELINSIQNDPIQFGLLQFGLLFDIYYSEIFNYIFRRTGDYDAAKDISSETFLKAFMARLMTILQFNEEFKMSGMSIASFTIHNTLEAGGTHLLMAPLIAVVFSLLGITLSKVQRYYSLK